MSIYFQFPSIEDYPILANPFITEDELNLKLLEEQLATERQALKDYLELRTI